MPSRCGSFSGGYGRPVSPLGSSRYETREIRPNDSRREQDNLRRHGTIRTHPAERHQESSPRPRPRQLHREPSFDYGVPPGVDISMFETRGIPGRSRYDHSRRQVPTEDEIPRGVNISTWDGRGTSAQSRPPLTTRRRERSPSDLSRLFGGLGISRSSSGTSSRYRNQSPPDFDRDPVLRTREEELDILDSGRPTHRYRDPLPHYGDVRVQRRGSARQAPHYSPQQAYVECYREEPRRQRSQHRYPAYEYDTRAIEPDFYERPYTSYR